jgi:soluble lytic murein transglycosylase-like protein
VKKKDHLALAVLALLVLRSPRKATALPGIVAIARAAGFPYPELAAAVAMAESGGNPNAVGDLYLGGSYGLWQINSKAHPQYSVAMLFDPAYNARAAFEISKGGNDWSPWTTFRTGAYRQYL